MVMSFVLANIEKSTCRCKFFIILQDERAAPRAAQSGVRHNHDILDNTGYIELYDLQREISERVGQLACWVRVEILSMKEAGGHCYLTLIQKDASGQVAARAEGRIWRSSSGILNRFRMQTGESLRAGITVVVRASVTYHPVFGMALVIGDIDPAYTIGNRELEKKKTIERLTREELIDRQKSVPLPFLPECLAVISSADAAGYGDFVKHLEGNRYGFVFSTKLYPALMQGDRSPASIISALEMIELEGECDAVLVLRGGGGEDDLSCFDDYSLCRALASSRLPVLTAIGHERDYHVADMVACRHFKTPTALADFVVEWYEGAEEQVNEVLSSIQDALMERIREAEMNVADCMAAIANAAMSVIRRGDDEVHRCLTNIRFAIVTAAKDLESQVALLEARIQAADPRGILRQGYVLAVDGNGHVMREAASGKAGENFSLRFSDGRWKCLINEVTTEKSRQ